MISALQREIAADLTAHGESTTAEISARTGRSPVAIRNSAKAAVANGYIDSTRTPNRQTKWRVSETTAAQTKNATAALARIQNRAARAAREAKE